MNCQAWTVNCTSYTYVCVPKRSNIYCIFIPYLCASYTKFFDARERQLKPKLEVWNVGLQIEHQNTMYFVFCSTYANVYNWIFADISSTDSWKSMICSWILLAYLYANEMKEMKWKQWNSPCNISNEEKKRLRFTQIRNNREKESPDKWKNWEGKKLAYPIEKFTHRIEIVHITWWLLKLFLVTIYGIKWSGFIHILKLKTDINEINYIC